MLVEEGGSEFAGKQEEESSDEDEKPKKKTVESSVKVVEVVKEHPPNPALLSHNQELEGKLHVVTKEQSELKLQLESLQRSLTDMQQQAQKTKAARDERVRELEAKKPAEHRWREHCGKLESEAADLAKEIERLNTGDRENFNIDDHFRGDL